MIYQSIYSSPLGSILLSANDSALFELCLPLELSKRSMIEPNRLINNHYNHPIIKLIVQRLDDYFALKQVPFNDLPLQPAGTPFQQQVWQQLNQIPYGKISSYGEIAQAINNPKAVRAVGGAVGTNPIAILLPCHRVLGKDHSLTGFSGGLEIKKTLLAIENISYKEQQQQQELIFE